MRTNLRRMMSIWGSAIWTSRTRSSRNLKTRRSQLEITTNRTTRRRVAMTIKT